MLRLGMLAGDSGHTVEFSRRLNHVGIDAEQWVEGARVVAAVETTSQIDADRIPGYVEQLRQCGVELLPRIEDLVGRVDAVLIETQDGGDHLEQARPFIEAGLPLFVDKPLATSTADARQIVAAARTRGIAFGSSSALRYALEVQDVQRPARGARAGPRRSTSTASPSCTLAIPASSTTASTASRRSTRSWGPAAERPLGLGRGGRGRGRPLGRRADRDRARHPARQARVRLHGLLPERRRVAPHRRPLLLPGAAEGPGRPAGARPVAADARGADRAGRLHGGRQPVGPSWAATRSGWRRPDAQPIARVCSDSGGSARARSDCPPGRGSSSSRPRRRRIGVASLTSPRARHSASEAGMSSTQTPRWW